MIFYAIYKNQENCNTIGDTLLQKTLGKILSLAMWPLGAAGRRGLLDSGELTAGLGQGRA
jgi:hypothetical protein